MCTYSCVCVCIYSIIYPQINTYCTWTNRDPTWAYRDPTLANRDATLTYESPSNHNQPVHQMYHHHNRSAHL